MSESLEGVDNVQMLQHYHNLGAKCQVANILLRNTKLTVMIQSSNTVCLCWLAAGQKYMFEDTKDNLKGDSSTQMEAFLESHQHCGPTLCFGVKASLIKVAKASSAVQIIYHSPPGCLFCGPVLPVVVKNIFRCAPYSAPSDAFFSKIQHESSSSHLQL